MTTPLTTLSEYRCFGGVQAFYSHFSEEVGLPMRFGVFLPPQAQQGPVGAVVYLAGLTCNEETFAIKAGAQRLAAELARRVRAHTASRDEAVLARRFAELCGAAWAGVAGAGC